MVSVNGHRANGDRSTLMSSNDVELREHLRVCHPDFPGPGTVLRLVFDEPGAVVRWDVDVPEPARTIIVEPQHLTAVGLGRDINAYLKATLAALGLEAAAEPNLRSMVGGYAAGDAVQVEPA